MATQCRCYGYFKCTNCQHSWESSWVFCERGKLEVALYNQDCSKCRQSLKPFRIVPLRCPFCMNEDCECHRRYWHYCCMNCQIDWKLFKESKIPRNSTCKACKTECGPSPCPNCKAVMCVCGSGQNARNVDINKPHRAELCGRCRSGLRCGKAGGEVPKLVQSKLIHKKNMGAVGQSKCSLSGSHIALAKISTNSFERPLNHPPKIIIILFLLLLLLLLLVLLR